MTVIRLGKFADDDGRLLDEGDAEILGKRLVAGSTIDFTDVVEVGPGFLDVLLARETPESIADRVTGMSPAVNLALARWVDRRESPPPPMERPRAAPRPRVPRPVAPPPPVERPPVSDDRFTPTRLVHRLTDALRGYIESAYPLSDPLLVRARRVLLETEAGGHLLAQDPFIETTPRYAVSAEGYAELGLPPHLAELFVRLTRPTDARSERGVLFSTLYRHQAAAFHAFFERERDLVVATGTGSGKTECFLVPMLGSLYEEARTRPASFAEPGVRALILYPMNALVNDQLGRLRLLFGEDAVATEFRALGGRAPRFGMYTGRTPYAGPRNTTRDRERVAPLVEYYLKMPPGLAERLRRLGRYPAKDLEAFYGRDEERSATYQTGKRRGKEYRKRGWERRLHTGPHDRELLTRHEMVHGAGADPGHSPDILVTNYSMLEYMLMRPFERPIFEETRRWLAGEGNRLLLVLDEAHMYRGARGAEVAFLLRRLRARLGIHDRPDKLRVIATSATLGAGPAARDMVCRFAADLVGKRPQDFEPITGAREVAEPAAFPSADDVEMLASLDLDALHRARDVDALAAALEPVFVHYGVTCARTDEASVLRALHDAMAGRPCVNLLIREAAGTARSLDDLARRVIGAHPRARRALEALLALGTLARASADAPGLVPTRVHAMFRGLHGLYACIDPACSGRQASPGAPATLGKLFTAPRARCDVCDGRVFELASCRSCGAPYVLAYAPSGGLARLGFLWGETEGDLVRVQLLPMAPRFSERTEELRVHLRAGLVGAELPAEGPDARSMYVWFDEENGREPSFGRCAMCQQTGHARIFDFRTRGEQPFAALIEAQFAEQPPQKHDTNLPNHGRKVLVFSDGRQKAARLAPALEHAHARDLFRQALARAADALRRHALPAGMHALYPAMVWLCANQGLNLFPASDEVEFHNHVRLAKERSLHDSIMRASRMGLRPTRSFAQRLFSELTDRYYSLQSLALATVEEDPEMEHVFEAFPTVGLDGEAARVLFRAWVRLHLERRSFRAPGAELRELGEGWAVPEGIDAERVTHLLPNRFADYLDRVLGGDRAAVEQVVDWFRWIVRRSDLLHLESDVYYLQPHGLSLNLRLDGTWLRCTDCGRIHPEALADLCPGCLGRVVDADADYLSARTGFYRDQVRRAFDPLQLEPFGLSAEEHSAQLTGQPDDSAFNRVEEYELRFQDIAIDGRPPIDVLSCTTTMEVGIDIGALCGVALRNVPPHVANYQQRAGRAGRRGRSIASVVTYAHGTSHDAHYFAHPEAIISGEVRAPIVYIENQQVLERHIRAYLLQRFFHATVPADTASNAYQLFEALGTVEQFLSRDVPCSLGRFESWLREHADLLRVELRHWVPTFSHGLGESIAHVDRTIRDTVEQLPARLRSILPVAEHARREEIEGLDREALERRLEESLLSALIGQAVLPRYAFPTDVVSFWVSKPSRPGDPRGHRTFEYEPQRDLQLALSEYAPTRSLTIDKWRFESAALFSPYQPSLGPTLARRQPYTACRDCTYVSLDAAAAAQSMCPCCGSQQLAHMPFITPPGFAPDINERREVDRGQAITYAGMTDRARLEVQDPPSDWHRELHGGRVRTWMGPRHLAVVNKGVKDRGFSVCPDCGRSEPVPGPGFNQSKLFKRGAAVNHRHPLEQGVLCTGSAVGPFYLGHRFPTDALLVRLRLAAPVRLASAAAGVAGRPAHMALGSLVEAIALAATRELQIDEGELSGWWTPVLGAGAQEAQLYLYDLLPGGAGYARAVGAEIERVLDVAAALLGACDCTQSCYRCLRHYRNNYLHASLDRHLALALLRHLRDGVVPEVTAADKAVALRGLDEVLALRGIEARPHAVGGVEIPRRLTLGPREVWLDVHHPLVDPGSAPSPLATLARASTATLLELDAFELVHDLPAAVARLPLPRSW